MTCNKSKRATVLSTAAMLVGAAIVSAVLAGPKTDPRNGAEGSRRITGGSGESALPLRASDEKKKAPEKEETPEKKVTRLGLVQVRETRDSIATQPTQQAPKPPVIHFFKGQKNEIRVAPGQSALIELSHRATFLEWEIPGYTPESVGGGEDDPEFEFVLCQWDANTQHNLVFTMYRRPRMGEKGTSPPVFPVPIAEATPEEKAEKGKLEARVKDLKLEPVLKGGAHVETKPTAKIPKPMIFFFKGEKNEVQLAPGRTVLIELSKPTKELAWQREGGRPTSLPGFAAPGTPNAPEFEFVLGRWEKHGDVSFTLYRRPAKKPAVEPDQKPAGSGEMSQVEPTEKKSATGTKVGSDLTKLNRTIRKEPAYSARPYYTLLAIGPDASKRVWMVLDGSTLFVDRNGNGDLTEEGERFSLTSTRELSKEQAYSHFNVFDISLGGPDENKGKTKYQLEHWIRDPDFVPKTDFDKTWARERKEWEQATLWRIMGDNRTQTAITFSRRPEDAQISHLGGPLTVRLRFPDQTFCRSNAEPLQVEIGTFGLSTRGNRIPAFSRVMTTELPSDVHPQAVIEFPGRRPTDPPVVVTVALKRRCCGDNFFEVMLVPLDAGTGTAKVTVSVPDWKEGKVAPATFEVPVVAQQAGGRR